MESGLVSGPNHRPERRRKKVRTTRIVGRVEEVRTKGLPCDAINLARSMDRLSARQTNVVRNSAGLDFGLALKSLQAPISNSKRYRPYSRSLYIGTSAWDFSLGSERLERHQGADKFVTQSRSILCECETSGRAANQLRGQRSAGPRSDDRRSGGQRGNPFRSRHGFD